MNPMRRTNLHSNVEVVVLLTLCTNFLIFAHFVLRSSPMNCTCDICLRDKALKTGTVPAKTGRMVCLNMGSVLHAHPVRGESHIQHNANR